MLQPKNLSDNAAQARYQTSGWDQARARFLRPGLVGLTLMLIGLVGWLTFGNKTPVKVSRASTVPVATVKVETRDFPVIIAALGSAQPWQGILIRSQVNGRLLRVPVTEGSDIKAGAIVAEVDPAPFQAALMQAEGALLRDQAQLNEARQEAVRYQRLATQNAISKQQVDIQTALARQDEGTVMLDQGAVRSAQVNLNYTQIRSPVDGRVGMRLVDAGNLVSTTDTSGIITINEVTPIAVIFTVPETDFQRLSAASDGFRRQMPVTAFSQETNVDLGAGDLEVTDNHVDASTGTVQLKARFPNADRRLWPGQFVNVRLTIETLRHAMLVPSVAVNSGPDGAFVFVVKKDKAVVRPVSILHVQDQMAVIAKGLEPGELVVTDGQMALRSGSKVRLRGGGRKASAS